MIIREILTKYGFKVNDKAIIRADKRLESLKRSALRIGLAVTGAAAALFGITASTAKAGDEALKTSAKLGLTVEALQELRFAGVRAGVDVRTTDLALQRFTRRAAEAAIGTGEAKDVFEQLGISLKKQDGRLKDTDQLFSEVQAAMSGVEDQGEKLRIAFKLFDSEGAALVNTLTLSQKEFKGLRQEARDLGIVISKSGTERSRQFQDQLVNAKAAVEGLRNIIGLALMPAIGRLLTQFKQWVIVNRKVIATRIEKFAKLLGVALKFIFAGAMRVVGVITDLVDTFGGAEKAMQFFAIAFATFFGGKALLTLGSFMQAMFSVVKLLKSMGTAALIAQIKIFAIPLAIGVMIALLALFIDDLINFGKGNDSIIGTLAKKWPIIGKIFKVVFAVVMAIWQNFLNSLELIFDVVGDIVDFWVKTWKEPEKIIENFEDVFKKIWGRILTFFKGSGAVLSKLFKSLFGDITFKEASIKVLTVLGKMVLAIAKFFGTIFLKISIAVLELLKWPFVKLFEFVSSIFTKIKDVITDALTSAFEAVLDSGAFKAIRAGLDFVGLGGNNRGLPDKNPIVPIRPATSVGQTATQAGGGTTDQSNNSVTFKAEVSIDGTKAPNETAKSVKQAIDEAGDRFLRRAQAQRAGVTAY